MPLFYKLTIYEVYRINGSCLHIKQECVTSRYLDVKLQYFARM